MIFNLSGGGGASLNFEVVCSIEAPVNPGPNTIWINSPVDMTSYIFSPAQPTGETGLVWIKTGTSSTVAFNALEENSLYVYPVSAVQYVDGAWMNRVAYMYPSGTQWSYERVYLYMNGPQTDTTGAWTFTKGTGTYQWPSDCTIGSTLGYKYSAGSGGSAWTYAFLYHNTSVPVNGATKVCIHFTKCSGGKGNDSNPILAISLNGKCDVNDMSNFVYCNTGTLPGGEHDLSVTIPSSLTSVKVGFYTEIWPGRNIDIAIDQIWLE